MADKKNSKVNMSADIAVINERSIRDKIYEVRGVQVMLDFELAEIYGYSTSAFNQQVKNNIAKFDNDSAFSLQRKKWMNYRCQKI